MLTDAPEFAAGPAHDQAAARAYRAALADPARAGFGSGLAAPSTAWLDDARVPRLTAPGGAACRVLAPPGWPGVIQMLDGAVATWSGRPRLARAAYTQLTPGGALPAVASRPRVGGDAGSFWIADDALGAAAVALLRGSRTAIALGADLASARAAATEMLAAADTVSSGPAGGDELPWPVARAVAYALDCAAAAAPGGTIAPLADHEILPLVWTRDAYYVCALLDAVGERTAVAGIARWLFTVAERPEGWWPRASLASGQAKDPVFQLDQQLWPVLIAERSGTFATEARAVVERLLAARTAAGLLRTAETPADDPLGEPYHFSSHLLLWRVLERLGHRAAAEVRATTRRAFERDGRFAYALAEDGRARQYHDANDVPTALAAAWGFCGPDDPVWRRTLSFAWSGANAAYVDGPLAGLGSLHTLHPWPLGDLQSLIVARTLGDRDRASAAQARLEAVETWDGLLPEAYDERTGAVASRHWFAWPAALRALLVLGRLP